MEQDHDDAVVSTARGPREPLTRLAGIAAAVRAAASCDRCTIQLVEGDELVITVSDPPLLLGPRARRRPIDAGIAGRVTETRAPVYLADLSGAGGEPAAEGMTAHARTYYGVPLVHGGKVLGVLQVDAARDDAFDAETRRRIDEIAGDLATELAGSPRSGDASAVIAHEIRRPLTSLRGLSDTLAELGDRLDRETVRTIARRIRAASVRLERLVQDLLDLARTGGMRLEVTSSDIEIGLLLIELASDRPDRVITCSMEQDLPRVRADPARLRQILDNLIENAARFSPEDTPIELRARREEGMVALSVTDHGIGIPEHETRRIFERFYQLDPERGGGGLGIGLALVREIADAMGIRVHVDSREGQGSTFTLLLPVAPS